MKSALALLAAPILAAAPFANAGPADPEAVRGRALYESMGCYECHGLAAQGGQGSGPALAPAPKPLAYFETYVRAPLGQMPPYTKAILSEDQLRAIHAYLVTIPPAKAVGDIPLLNPQPQSSSRR